MYQLNNKLKYVKIAKICENEVKRRMPLEIKIKGSMAKRGGHEHKILP